MREDEISGGAPEDAHYILKQSYPLTNQHLLSALDSDIIPDAQATRDLGATNKIWNYIYVNSGYFESLRAQTPPLDFASSVRFQDSATFNLGIASLDNIHAEGGNLSATGKLDVAGKIIGGSKLYIGYTEAQGDPTGINGLINGDMIAVGGYIGASKDFTFNYYSAFYVDSNNFAVLENFGGGIKFEPASGTYIRAHCRTGDKFRIWRGLADYFDMFWETTSLFKLLCNDAVEIETGAGDDIILDSGSDRVKIEDFMNLKPSSAPASPLEGDVYYDSTANKLKVYNGTAWETISSS